ncbi:D-arabinitol 2-dehydrogenase [Fusarium pseudocircinatum]|uniref:D-arabinitol 2-dehydrogenase n=1 Tax=Fusarium pseudocircinatum TaxID=56676 RepID=A0A8H5KSG9_9HYPO|nr:D-arabinitol 2-dehydrogenase [Fusarium pseudocircinatum]
MGTSVTEVETTGGPTTAVAQQHQTKVTLLGKVIAITGANRGIGLGVAEACLDNGAQVVYSIDYAEPGEEFAAAKKRWQGKLKAIQADVTKEATVVSAVDHIVESEGALHGMVVNAGRTNHKAALDFTEEEIHALFDINVFGAFYCARAAARAFIKLNIKGAVVFTASMASYRPNKRVPSAPYGASKAGIRNMTHTLAMEWAKYNIRVNSVSPGLVDTAMTYWVPQQPDWEQQLKYYGGMPRLAQIQELGGAYVYLLSDAASYTTSIDIPVNGVIGNVTDENGNGPGIPLPPPLDVLDKFTGTFKGFGFNPIFRPLSRNPKTITKFPKPPTDSSTSNLLRGLFDQADIDLIDRPYTQSIVDAMPNEDGTTNATPPVIHFEPGLWMRVPQVEDMPELPASFCRMGSIPHGTTINAQGFQPARTSKGALDIDATDITPLDLSKFIANGTITQEIINDPNTILRQAHEGKNIIENTMFIVSTNAPPGAFGGGTSNIGFNIGSDEGKEKDASREKKSGNANAVDVTAQYWVSKIRAEIELDPSMSVG